MCKKILVAEDSYALANLLSFVLKNAGFEPEIFRTGKAALESALVHTYDVLLLDQQMPGLTGVEVVEAIREAGVASSTPVFLCTAKCHELDLEDMRQRLGVVDVLQKPFSPKELIATLRAATENSALVVENNLL